MNTNPTPDALADLIARLRACDARDTPGIASELILEAADSLEAFLARTAVGDCGHCGGVGDIDHGDHSCMICGGSGKVAAKGLFVVQDDRYTPYKSLSACDTAAIRAVRLLEDAEDHHANCPECEGEGVPELCETCFPFFDAARVERRLVMQSLAALQSPPPVVSGEAVERARAILDATKHSPDCEIYLDLGMQCLSQCNCDRIPRAMLTFASHPADATPPVVEEGRREAVDRKAIADRAAQQVFDGFSWETLTGPENLLARLKMCARQAVDDAILALTPVEGVGEREAVNRILAELLAPLMPDVAERIEVGNRVCSLILASLSTPATAQGDERRMLLDLLAIIHRDGGQHVDDVGIEQATTDAIRLSAERIAQGGVREALEELEVTERNYRLQHNLHGGDDMRTGKAWDQMRRAGDRARNALATLKGQDNG